MDEYDDNRELEGRRKETEGSEDIGTLLKRLRGRVSLREVTRRTGVSSSYLSQIERGVSRPGAIVVRKLAELYHVDSLELLKRAGHGPQPDPYSNEAMDVERAYRFVLADPAFRVGTRPDGPLTVNAKRFIVEMYEKFTGKRLLQ
ncbi:MAG: helix-turn-helix domain-containing protein [Chloroflexi bacterium]|nr:helix-turn-helix domain-containing protein [Chloroflexota bacterium]MYD49431.1 helix-turn-helix domain-containing protein [Chloroflexota bacterium]